MPLRVPDGHPTLFIRREAFERANLIRHSIDERLNLTDEEFRVEGDLIAIGPVYDDEALGALIADLEQVGLAYFEDFFELSGNWPAWLVILAGASRGGE